MAGEDPSPAYRGWVVSIHAAARGGGQPRLLGTGVLVDPVRVLTCRHVVEGHDPASVVVEFPFAADVYAPAVRVAEIRLAQHPHADVAVLDLAGELPAGVSPARLRRPNPDASVPSRPGETAGLRGLRWWAFGFANPLGNEADGAIGGALGRGWIRLDSSSRY